MSGYTVSVLPNRGDEYDLDGPFSLDAAFTAAAAAYARADCHAVHVRDARTGELVREYSGIGSHGDEAIESHLWPCGCLKNDAGAHRVGCPDHPEGVRGR